MVKQRLTGMWRKPTMLHSSEVIAVDARNVALASAEPSLDSYSDDFSYYFPVYKNISCVFYIFLK